MRTDSSNPAPEGRRLSGLAAVTIGVLGLLAAGYVLQLLGILLAAAPLVISGAALGILTEVWLLIRGNGLARGLVRAQLYHPVRQILRDGLLLGGLARLEALRPGTYAASLLVAMLGCWATHFMCQAVAAKVRHSRRLPIVTRNIDVSALRIDPAPPAIFGRNGAVRLLGCAALVTAGSALTAATVDARWGALTALACWAVLLGGLGHLVSRLLPGRRPAGEEEVLAWLDGWLAAYRPTVGMYFSGGLSSAYQANMWLSTLASLEGRPIIVLRERFMVQRIDATDVPIICIPKVAHLMRLEHSTLPVLLHPSNSGKTSQVLRIPTIKHAFINHGESDKLSSCNPYAKAYDEVWVAGPAARERYRLADIGVDDRDVVEVGRPQLAPVRAYTGPPAPGARIDVLYAPTWEGWTDDPGNTSLPLAGERIVRALLDDPGVRLLYKPHPMTGSVDPAVKEADSRIRALIAEANAQRPSTGGREPAMVEAAAELQRRAAELEALSERGARRSEDEAERMLRQPAPTRPYAAEVLESVEAWEECFWRASPPGEHLVLAGPRPGIYACLNQADLLISDVSSVVPDCLSSEKPYAVVNTTGLPEDDFRSDFPTVRAATILTPTAEGIPALLHSVRDPAADSLRTARAQLKAYLLGPDEPPSTVRFNKAVQDLRVEAMAHRARSGAQQLTQQLTEQDGQPGGRMDGPVTSAAASPGLSREDRADEPHPSDQLLADALGDDEAF
jgi:hypothetical protein